MIEMFDTDGSGDIDYQGKKKRKQPLKKTEFAGLYNYIRQMTQAYQAYDPYGEGLSLDQAQRALATNRAIAHTGTDRGVLETLGRHKKITLAAFVLLAVLAGSRLTRMEKRGEQRGGWEHHGILAKLENLMGLY